MPRVRLGREVDRWLDTELAGPRHTAVDRLLAGLAEPAMFLGLQRRAGEATSIDVEIPDTDLIATCLLVPVLDVIVIESIGSVESA